MPVLRLTAYSPAAKPCVESASRKYLRSEALIRPIGIADAKTFPRGSAARMLAYCGFRRRRAANRESHALASGSEALFDSAYRHEIQNHLAEAIKALSEKEQLVLSLYYYEELTMKEIGVTLGYTESRISQIHTKAVLKLKTKLAKKLRADDLPEFIPQGELRALPPKRHAAQAMLK